MNGVWWRCQDTLLQLFMLFSRSLCSMQPRKRPTLLKWTLSRISGWSVWTWSKMEEKERASIEVIVHRSNISCDEKEKIKYYSTTMSQQQWWKLQLCTEKWRLSTRYFFCSLRRAAEGNFSFLQKFVFHSFFYSFLCVGCNENRTLFLLNFFHIASAWRFALKMGSWEKIECWI